MTGLIGANGKSFTFTNTYALAILFGGAGMSGMYGLRSSYVSTHIDASSIDVSADGTTYTIVNNSTTTQARYIIFLWS